MKGKLLKCALLAVAAVTLSGAKPQPVRLDVTGQPERAKVFVDGTFRGELHGALPCTVSPLGPGRHLLHVEASIFEKPEEM